MPVIDAPDKLPSVDRLLNDPDVLGLREAHGATLVTRCARQVLASARERVLAGNALEAQDLVAQLHAEVACALRPSLRRVFNLTGTVLHTNLGRAALPPAAIDAMVSVARGASNLEFDLDSGKRGDRHAHCGNLLRELTGAESALVVNNNAAAVLLTLNSLALRRQVPVSRGELIEIGGAFRMPDIMARAGCKLVEVGTTNRTHPRDYAQAIGPGTALLLKVHTSNYAIQGFTASLDEAELAAIAQAHGIPLVSDLGSGNLIDLGAWGLPREPTVRDVLTAGTDVVTFSGDKLLGGPQAGIVAGRRDLIEKIRRNPMTRALRPDKLTLAALEAVLRLYTDPARLAETLPTLRYLTRDIDEIGRSAARLAPIVQAQCEIFDVSVERCKAQVGSGALPVDTLASVGLKLALPARRRPGKALKQLAAKFRQLPIPVIGRIDDDALWLDLRCLDDEAAFIDNLRELRP